VRLDAFSELAGCGERPPLHRREPRDDIGAWGVTAGTMSKQPQPPKPRYCVSLTCRESPTTRVGQFWLCDRHAAEQKARRKARIGGWAQIIVIVFLLGVGYLVGKEIIDQIIGIIHAATR
jgi:hypothetical protein